MAGEDTDIEKLIERARENALRVTGPSREAWKSRDLLNELTTALSAQRQEIERLREGLRPFAERRCSRLRSRPRPQHQSRIGPMADFVEAEGEVHMLNPLMGGEFTLCGDAFDLASDEDGYEQTVSKRRTVTCPHCAKVIRECRGVRIA